jgi:hypothetical protein
MFQTFVFKTVTGFVRLRCRTLFFALDCFGGTMGLLASEDVPARQIKRL